MHTVGFDGPADTITLTHTARDRTAFARGALLAATWVKGRRGWFTMQDVLGLDSATGARRIEFRRMKLEVRSKKDSNMRTKFTGLGTALVTPFTRSGDMDEAGGPPARAPADRQRHALLVPAGTTGENPTLELAERIRMVEILVDEAKGQVPVLAGCRRLQHARESCTSRRRCRRPAPTACCR